MIQPEKYIHKRRIMGQAKYQASLRKWSPLIGKYIKVPIQHKPYKKGLERKIIGDKRYRRYKIGAGLFLRSYPSGHKEIWDGKKLWETGQKTFPDQCMLEYYYLDFKYLKRKRKYGWG